MTDNEWICVELTHTRGWEARDRDDDELDSYEALLAWGERRGAVSSREAGALRAAARSRPREAAQVLRDAIALRDVVYRLLRAACSGAEPDPDDVALLNGWLGRSGAKRGVRAGSHPWTWTWLAGDRVHLDRLLWPVALATAELLTSNDAARLRCCAADDCGWIFIDTSRNHSKRWCSMSDCGNRAKVRRFRKRHAERT